MSSLIKPVTLQSMAGTLGPDEARRYCAPLCFYMLLHALGAIDPSIMPGDFCARLDRKGLGTTNSDWSRPALSRYVRDNYPVDVVSWHLNGGANIAAMRTAGYLENEREVDFFQKQIIGRSPEQIVAAGYPTIVTMQPNFDHGGNNIHAIILASWSNDEVLVVDPDARNPKTRYQPGELRPFISQSGAGTILLPRA